MATAHWYAMRFTVAVSANVSTGWPLGPIVSRIKIISWIGKLTAVRFKADDPDGMSKLLISDVHVRTCNNATRLLYVDRFTFSRSIALLTCFMSPARACWIRLIFNAKQADHCMALHSHSSSCAPTRFTIVMTVNCTCIVYALTGLHRRWVEAHASGSTHARRCKDVVLWLCFHNKTIISKICDPYAIDSTQFLCMCYYPVVIGGQTV